MKAIVIRDHGSADRLVLEDVDDRVPSRDEVAIQVTHAGVNFMDIGVRQGLLWRDKPLPLVPGVEGAGVITAVGEGVRDLIPGQRVAWPYVQGSYAESVLAPAASVVALPDAIESVVAAGMMMQGLTAMHIALRFHATQPGDIVLVHAAAGGVGSLLCQLVKMRGGTVIGRVSDETKVAQAKQAGAEHVIVDAKGQFADAVLALTDGRGVNAVFDGSGAATFADSLASLAPLGTLAYFGPVLGAPPPVNIAALKKSVKIGFPIYADSVANHEQLVERSAELFSLIGTGALQQAAMTRYALGDASRAHVDLEARRSVGKLVLTTT